jgi:hypothetical protein
MRIDFKRSGGFAGLRMSKTIDTNSLNPDESKRVINLVESSGFFDLSPTISGTGADRYRYHLTIDWDGRKHSVQIDESAIPPKLVPLIEWIERK